MRVEVYRNLHKNCWSIRDRTSKLVIGHAGRVVLKHCRMRVSEAGRQRVLREKRKNVHAWIEGDWTGSCDLPDNLGDRVSYNPYLGPNFTAGGLPVTESSGVYMDEGGKVWLN